MGRPNPPFPSPFPSFLLLWFGPYRGRTSPFVADVFPLLAHKAHIACRGLPGTPSGDPIRTRYPRTLPVSKYYRPIYESLPLDRFETPRHVSDLIQDSEQHSGYRVHISLQP